MRFRPMREKMQIINSTMSTSSQTHLSFAQRCAQSEAPKTQVANIKSKVVDKIQDSAVAVAFTLVKSQGSLSKTISLDSAGKIKKGRSGVPYSGSFLRVSHVGTPHEIMLSLAEKLKALQTNMALMCAPPPQGQEEWPLVTKKELANNHRALARTPENFLAPVGPTLLMLDFDTADFSLELQNKIATAGGILGALASVYPPFRTAARLERASASSSVMIDEVSATAKRTGEHHYFIVNSGTKVEKFVNDLGERTELAGFAWSKVAETGATFARPIFDVIA
jgi:hypothetical protein